MKSIYVILLFLYVVSDLQAQESAFVIIRGKAVDRISNEAVRYATVFVKKNRKSNELLKGVVTDSNGEFELKMKKQSGLFCIQSLEYAQFQKELLQNIPDTIDLGVIKMQKANYMLDEVTVKPLLEESADEIRYNLKQDPDREHADMLEMLGKIPFLEILPTGKIQIANSTNFVVVRNGKVDAMFVGMPLHEILKKLPAMGFETIRILRNPPLRYGDVDYVLDIVTDRTKRVVGAVGYTSGHFYSEEGRTVATASTSFSAEKLRGYIGGNISSIRSPKEKQMTKQKNWKEELYIEQKYEKKDESDGGSIRSDFSYDLSEKQFLTTNIYYHNLKRENQIQTHQKEQHSEVDIQYTTKDNHITKNDYLDLTLSYQYDIDPDQKVLNVSGNLYQYRGKGNEIFSQHGYQERQELTANKTHTYDYKLQVNYFHLFNSTWSTDVDLSYYYREYYTEKIDQVGKVNIMDKQYGVVSGNIAVSYKRPKISLTGRVLLEYLDDDKGTFLKDEMGEHYISEKGFEWIPSLRTIWQIPRGSLTVSYTSFRQRPNLSMLDPRVPDANAKILYVGNPNLKSSVNHSLALSWLRMKKITMTATLSCHFSDNNIKSYWYINEQGQTINSYKNGAYSRLFSAAYSVSKRIKKLSLAPAYNMNYQYSKVDEEYSTRTFNHLFTFKIQYQFKNGLLAIVNPAYSIWHHSKNYTKQTPFSCSFSLRKSWLKGKMNTYIRVKNIMSFNTTRTTYVNSPDFDISVCKEKMALPLEFNISYSFGNYKVKSVRLPKRKAEIDDVMK